MYVCVTPANVRAGKFNFFIITLKNGTLKSADADGRCRRRTADGQEKKDVQKNLKKILKILKNDMKN